MNRRNFQRKTAPKVKSGKVQKKNRVQFTTRLGYVIDRQSPAKGCKHVLTKKDVHMFTDIIPGWRSLSTGIELILLSSGIEDYDGVYEYFKREKTGIIDLSAWEKDLWQDIDEKYFLDHKDIFDLLGVVYEEKKDGWTCFFTESQAKAFMLLHVFMHELGHHIDRLESKNQYSIPGGELFAEKFAMDYLEQLWPLYIEKFGKP